MTADALVAIGVVAIALIGLVIVFAFLPTIQRSNAKVRGVSSGLAGVADEIWHPERMRGMAEWEAEVSAPAPAPSPGDKDLDAGRIRIEL